MSRAAGLALLALALVASLAGCGGVPVTHYYVLEPQDVAASAAAATHGLSIGVRPFRVDAPYDQDRIVYRGHPDSAEVGFYAYHRWASPLSRMLPAVVAAALGSVRGIASIEPEAPGRVYDATLRGRVLALEEVDEPGGVRTRVRLSLTLTAADGTELWSRTLTDDGEPTAAAEVPQVVTRMRTTLEHLLTGSRPSLEQALK